MINSSFVISLDFELYWGVRDHTDLLAYRRNLLGARQVIPLMLELFSQENIHATWAVVGFLFCDGREELVSALPSLLPEYEDPRLSPYNDLHRLGVNEFEDPFHFAPSLIRAIASTPHQEIGSHTFSHYCCLEKGQDVEAFRADLQAAKRVAKKIGIELRSLVFPRNQYDRKYLQAAHEAGIQAFRGTAEGRIHRSRTRGRETLLLRTSRLVDSYLPLTTQNAPQCSVEAGLPFNVPGSAFLRPWSRSRRVLEDVRFARLARAMENAARSGSTFHLWWHPHNFGVDQQQNLAFLGRILRHFAKLKERYGMQSRTMFEAASVACPQHTRSTVAV